MTNEENTQVTDTITPDETKVTVGFKRSVRVREYENAEASIMVTATVNDFAQLADQDTALALVDAAKNAFFGAKSVVYEQLGITFEVSDGIAIEGFEKHLGAVEVTSQDEARAVASATNATPQSKGPGAAPTSKDALWAELAANPSKYFDNRTDKAAKGNTTSPDFKRKGTGEPLWIEYKGKNQVPDGIVLPSAA